MRLSPVLVAFLATSATFSVSNAAKGEAAPSTGQDSTVPAYPAASGKHSGLLSFSERLGGSPEAKSVASSIPSLVRLTSGSTQLPILKAQGPGTPQPLRPGDLGTPLQGTPNQLQITPNRPAPSPSLTVPSEVKPPVAPPSPSPGESTPPITPPTGQPSTPSDQTAEPETRVLVSEVAVIGVEPGPILDEVYKAIRTQPGRTTTRSQLQEDINAIFGTGYFSNVRAVPEDTPLGVRVTFEVKLNPVLQSVRLEGKRVLPDSVANEAFSPLYGNVLNLVQLQDAIKKVNKWYQDNGYVLAQVVDSPKVSPDGVVTLEVAEGVVEGLQVRYIDKDGNECKRDDKGKFILVDQQGNRVVDKNNKPLGCHIRTRPYIVTREFELKPGDTFNRAKVEQDLQRAYGLGIFEDVKLSLQPGQDPRKVVVVANVVEKNTGSIAAGAGVSSSSGLFGTVSYQQQNVGGNNQKFGAEFSIGQREILFDLSFTDPWIGGDPFRTSYTVNLFRRQTISLIFDGGKNDVRLPFTRGFDQPRVVRTGGGITFTRPLNGNPYRRAEWVGSLGFQYQRVAITDSNGRISPVDEFGNQLSFSSSGRDDLFSVQFGIVRDLRDNALRPTRGSLLRFGSEQWLPIGSGSIFGNRLRAGYSYYIPSNFIKFTKGCRGKNPSGTDCPQTIAFNIQGGGVLGDLPPYEAFALGGSNSVRGYDEGDLAAARYYVQGTVEYRFPVFSIISGALFLDAATDFGSQGSVPGDPGGVRGKPGSGFGYGLGVRIQSPLGPIRVDFGINDQGKSRFHFGIGERF